ncbi:MAG: AsmA family protein, partial [Vicinamibacterales bacterium]
MKKAALTCLAVVILLLVAAPVALWMLLDPDDLKARAAAYVKESTGRELAITGPVSLSFFPWLGGVMKTASLAPPVGFGDAPFASIDELDLKVKAMPLLGGDIVIDTVRIKGVRLRFEARRDGRTTWDGLIPAAAAAEAAPTSSPRLLQVAGLELRDGEVVWADEAGGRYELKGVELTTGAFGRGEPSDVALSFTVGGLGGAPIPVSLTSRVTLDPPQSRVLLEDVKAKIDQSTITGHLSSEPGKGPEALRTWRGDLAIDRIRAYGLTASDVTTTITATAGTAKIGPASGRFYGGQYRGTFDIDARGREPIVQADQRLTGVDIGPLLEDMQLLGGVTGIGELVTLKAKMRGSSLRTLAGSASLSIRDGQLEGADVLKMIEQARAMAAEM